MRDLINISINPDDPIIFGMKTTAMDYLIAAVYWEWTLKEIHQSLFYSIELSEFSVDLKKKIKEQFVDQWEKFTDRVNF